MGQGHRPILTFQPCANLQSVGRVPVSSASLGRQRPYSCFGKQGSLQKSALGITFPPLVPEYGFTLERGRQKTFAHNTTIYYLCTILK
mgnify:FL=1